MTRRNLTAAILLSVFVFPTLASAEPTGAKLPFETAVFGHFQKMMQARDFQGKTSLARAAGRRGIYGLGALAGLTGEVLVLDGEVLVTRGARGGGVVSDARNDKAALLVTAKVTKWLAVPMATAMSQAEVERFVLDTATKQGLRTTEPFPFRITGTVTDYQWHVLNGPQAHGAGHNPQAGKGQFVARGGALPAELLGFYSSAKLEGAITHPGEFFHVHIADTRHTVAGHLDSYGVAAGATLHLPKPTSVALPK